MRILVIGSAGQIGSELVPKLWEKYGFSNIIASDIKYSVESHKNDDKIYLDVLDRENLSKIISKYDIDIIYHLASILSARGEENPPKTWNVNMYGLLNILEVGIKYDIKKIIWPSSIAAFGPSSPKENTPNETILKPITMYGITKVSGELLLNYYKLKYNLDVRSVRLPGIISAETKPGGGTTDYAVQIFYEAIKNNKYTSYVSRNTILPMMYMPDCIASLINIMEADKENLTRCVYNVSGMSFSAGELADEIKIKIPDFEVNFKPDERQLIANSWPKSIDDSFARKEWNWNPKYNLSSMTEDMIEKLKEKLL
ncbi:MAG: NAD-dependent epimerase/dehydratase family protein [Promethearchaeati archaeon]